MRNNFYILAAIFIGFGIGYFFAAHFKDKQLQNERNIWQNRVEEEKLHALKQSQPSSVSPVLTTNANIKTLQPNGQEIINKLIDLRPQIGNRKQSIRQIIHHLQCLVDLGSNSLNPIRGFLAQYQDVDYGIEGETTGRPGGRGLQTSRTQPLSDFILPPSLRLGLVDVLKEIGGAEAEKILADMLVHSGRAVEVVYVAKILEEIAPKKYRETALNAAKELLVNPPASEKNATLDENATSYLYELINSYQDPSFVVQAQKLLITPTGQISRNALNYLSEYSKDQVATALYHAFIDPRVVNIWDKTILLNAALPYAGSNYYANALFEHVLTNGAITTQLRNYAIQNLANAPRNADSRGALPDNSILEGRLVWLQNMRNMVSSSNAVLAIDETMQRIRQTIARQSAPTQPPVNNP
jgi:hypothetical protein